MHELLNDKVIAVDVAHWVNESIAMGKRRNLDDVEIRIKTLQDIFSRVRALVVRCGVRYVVGVIDASSSNENKRRAGNVTKNGHHLKRNPYGLNKDIVALFKAIGFHAIFTPPDLGEGEGYCAQLQKFDLVDLIDCKDGDAFAYGASEVLKDVTNRRVKGNSL